MNYIAKNIRYLRKKRRMSQSDLGDLVNRAESTIQMWETDLRSPTMETVRDLAKIFHIDINTLVYVDLENETSNHQEIFFTKPQVPILGIVPCGEPIEAIEDIIEWIEVVPSQAKGHFGLIAKGDSMSPYILDGDILIVKYTPEVNSGKIAIVKVNGDEATCKRLMINDAGITLMPYNPAYDPLSFTPQEVEEKPVMIIGEVVEIRRRF